MLRPSAPTARADAVRVVGVLHPLDPLDERAAREHERRADRDDPDLGTVAGACRLPKSRITTNESAGISGTSHALSRKNIGAQPFIVSTSSRSALCRLR